MMNRLESPPVQNNDQNEDDEFTLKEDIEEEEEKEARLWEEETIGMEQCGSALWGEVAEWRREHPPTAVRNRQNDIKTARPEGTKVDDKKEKKDDAKNSLVP